MSLPNVVNDLSKIMLEAKKQCAVFSSTGKSGKYYLPGSAHVQLKQECQKDLQGLSSFPVLYLAECLAESLYSIH